MEIKTVFCDIDGTLINTNSLKCESWFLAILFLNPEIKLERAKYMETYMKTVGSSTLETAKLLVEAFGLDERIEELIRTRKHFKLALYQDDKKLKALIYHKTLLLLKIFIAYGYEVILVTTEKDYAERLTLILGLEELALVKGLEKSRNNPEGYKKALDICGKRPEECLVIEDSQSGVEAARFLGIKVVAIKDEFTRQQDFKEATIVVEDRDKIDGRFFDELLHNLQK